MLNSVIPEAKLDWVASIQDGENFTITKEDYAGWSKQLVSETKLSLKNTLKKARAFRKTLSV